MKRKKSQEPGFRLGEILLYRTEDGKAQLEVQLRDETAWLTQAQMAEFFQTTVPNVNIHIRHVYEEGELAEERTIKNFLIVRQEGGRRVQRNVQHYNLDVIISIGYRVKSHRGTQLLDPRETK